MGRLGWSGVCLPAVRRIAVAVAGFGVLAGGVALLVLPGPGLLVIAIGFAILAREFSWAARIVAWFKSLVWRMRVRWRAAHRSEASMPGGRASYPSGVPR